MYYFFSKIFDPILNISNLIFFLFIIFTFSLFFSKKKIFKYSIYFLVLFLFAISFLSIGKIGLKYLEKDYYNQKKYGKVDNIFVLGAAENLSATKQTNKINLYESSERLYAAIKLSLENPSAKVYFIGGNNNIIQNSIDETIVAKKFFKGIGFDHNKIVFISDTRNTIENIKAIQNLNILSKSNILITSAFHMKRSLIISDHFKVNLIPYAVDFRSISNPKLINRIQNFDVSKNLSNFNIFANEIIGIIAFRLFY